MLSILALAKARAQRRYPQRSRPSEQRRPASKATQPSGRERKGRLATSLVRCSPLRGSASRAPCHPPLLTLRAANSSTSTVSYRAPLAHAAAIEKTCSMRGEFSPCSIRSARTRNASASTRDTACARVRPYAITPGICGISAIQRPSFSFSISTAKVTTHENRVEVIKTQIYSPPVP